MKDSSQNLFISPSGLVIVVNSQEKDLFALSNLKFSSGIYYLEFFCPYSAEDIEFGLVH